LDRSSEQGRLQVVLQVIRAGVGEEDYQERVLLSLSADLFGQFEEGEISEARSIALFWAIL
jgi:hypothetical protein